MNLLEVRGNMIGLLSSGLSVVALFSAIDLYGWN